MMTSTETSVTDESIGSLTDGTPTLSRAGYFSIGVYLSLVGIAATIGNVIVIIVLLRDKKLTCKPHSLILLNLAVSDLGISIFGYPYTTASGYAGHWLFGITGCQVYGFMCTLMALTDINTLVTLSIYRYVAICKPHLELTLRRPTVIGSLLVLTWIYSLFWAVSAFGWTSYDFESFGTSCSINWDGQSVGDISYTLLMICFCYVTHVAIMTYCYVHVLRKSREVMKKLRGDRVLSADDAVSVTRVYQERKRQVLSMVMVITFTAIWSPYAWVSVWTMIHPSSLPVWMSTLPTMFAKSSCMINPIIYLFTNDIFRREATKIMCALCWKNKVHIENAGTQDPENAAPANQHFFVVDRTPDGIYTGERTVALPDNLTAF